MFFLQIRVEGSTRGIRQELVDLLSYVARTGITPEVGLSLPFERAAECFRAMHGGDSVGKIVLTR